MVAGIEARFAIRHPGFVLDVALSLPGRGISALFGPSGSGKTSCLRAVAGLDRVRDGYLAVNGIVWQDDARRQFLPAHRRAVGYIFQEASLFPHLSVRRNLEFGRRRARDAALADVGQTARLMNIEALLDRLPDRLSGGERQRVAIARALLSTPRLLLLDEPLAALDAARRAEIIPFLERLHRQLEIPAIYVSHNAEEVFRLADYLVVLGPGRVLGAGPLQEIASSLDLAGAFADQAGVIVEATAASHDDAEHLTRLDFAGGTMFVDRRPEPAGTRVRCRVLARDVSLALERPAGTSILNLIRATVVGMAASAEPSRVMVRLDAGGTPLLAGITLRSWNALRLAPGREVWAQVKTTALPGAAGALD